MGSKRPHDASPTAATRRATLTDVMTGHEFPIADDGDDDGRVTIGRALTSAIVVEERFVSESHCYVAREKNGRYVVCDPGSGTGTYVNCEPIPRNVPVALEHSDLIGFGEGADNVSVTFRFAIAGPGATKRPRLDDRGPVDDVFAQGMSEIGELMRQVDDCTANLRARAETQRSAVEQLTVRLAESRDSLKLLKRGLLSLVANELNCTVCDRVPSNATVLNCGHVFCGECVAGRMQCPDCKTLLVHANRSLALKNFLQTARDSLQGSDATDAEWPAPESARRRRRPRYVQRQPVPGRIDLHIELVVDLTGDDD